MFFSSKLQLVAELCRFANRLTTHITHTRHIPTLHVGTAVYSALHDEDCSCWFPPGLPWMQFAVSFWYCTNEICSDRGLLTYFFHVIWQLSWDSMHALWKLWCAPIICCKSSRGISGNHVFKNDVRLHMIVTSWPVIKLPFVVEWKANLQKNN